MTSQFELRVLTMLRSATLMEGMETRHLRKLATIASELMFKKDEIIYQKGEEGQAIYLIESGQVVIETLIPGQGQIIISTLGSGQFFGWSSLFPGERKMAWTRATEATRVIAFNAAKLRDAWQTDHNLEYAIVRRAGRDMTNRIRITRQQLADMLTA